MQVIVIFSKQNRTKKKHQVYINLLYSKAKDALAFIYKAKKKKENLSTLVFLK